MKRFTSLFIIIVLLFNLSSCITIPDVPARPEPEAGFKEELDDWVSASRIDKGITTTIIKGEPTDLAPLVAESITVEGAEWTSECEAVVAVEGGVALGNKYGRTTVTATDIDGNSVTVTVAVEFLLSTKSDYEISGTKDERVRAVSSLYEADRLLDVAISQHKSKIVIDFSAIPDFKPFEDYIPDIELGSHVSLTKVLYTDSETEMAIEIKYLTDTASTYTETAANYRSLTNGNMLARLLKYGESEYKRADDFDGFAINTENRGTVEVYNTEELWYALEHMYLPTFPREGTKAELFYERAKMILRDIITEDMTDYDKVLAIFDYLIDSVTYDHSAADEPNTKGSYKNVCYYLEGVFERGLAVCDGKAKAFVLFCAIEGIECLRDTGKSKTDGVGHAWNYVNLDGYWYLVDTTAADAAQGSGTSMVEFYMYKVEFNSYRKFLTNTAANSDEYEYSTVHANVPLKRTGERALESIEKDIYGTDIDFHIDDKSELFRLIKLVKSAGVLDFQLTVTLDDSDEIFDMIKFILEYSGISFTYRVFSAELYSTEICYVVFRFRKDGK